MPPDATPGNGKFPYPHQEGVRSSGASLAAFCGQGCMFFGRLLEFVHARLISRLRFELGCYPK
ncbi:MAG: hypothetical protein KatS3mg110_2227 [Pirellulaceae bacterium]|nr:MAG: hypothetical protein KatS3mg110_2227 [Pirellulaceae bacterium]